MRLKLCICIFILFIVDAKLFAQLTGCEIGNNIYTSLNGNLDVGITVIVPIIVSVRNYDNPALSTLSNACPRAINISPVSGGAALTLCVANGNLLPLGRTVTYNRLDPPLQCTLDDYSWALGASAAALGMFVIRKRNKFF
ncbi:hypothetical protein [Pedobacter agri]|uniref:hypothetical protein n=1 Tax=Pedobacter agri TaxID=454586 RepID=UPI00292EFAAF|nr:hypothetical protein [Pedobacter agri]